MKKLLPILLIIASACGTPDKEATQDPAEKAQELAKKFILIDGHVDLPYRMAEFGDWIDVSNRTSEGDFDYERAVAGGLDAPFMSIYIPADLQVTGGGKQLADSLIDKVNEIATRYPDKFALATTAAAVEENFRKGLISLPMGMENGAGLEDDLNNVDYFHNRGIRYITLTHSKDNLICDSSYDTARTWNGLSDYGRDVVREMNRVGIMIDISHVSDDTFFQVMELTEAPVIASHSSCRHFTPGFERNMSDEMILKLKDNGGVIQINFGTSFLDGELQSINRANQQLLQDQLDEAGETATSDEGKAIIAAFQQAHPYQYSDVSKVADHIDHVVSLVGVDHVGIGSDYDGVGDSLPTGLKDVSEYPNLIAELLQRGYTEEDIQKICSGNVLRVWKKVEAVAAQS